MTHKNKMEAFAGHMSRADLNGDDLAPTTVELALDWDGRARKVRELVETRIAPAQGPATIFVSRSLGL